MKSHITTYYDPFDKMPHMKDRPIWWRGKLYQLDDKDYEILEIFRLQYKAELEPLEMKIAELEEEYNSNVFKLINNKEVK